MASIDYIVILLYFLGLIFISWLMSKRITSSQDMFIAGRNSSWWLSGISTYMTIFSASTFVVWGGVAYRSGLVAVIVGNMLGLASIVAGRWLSGKWRSLKLSSPGEFLTIRFGKKTVDFYTIAGIVGRSVHTAVALYAIAIVTKTLMPIPDDSYWSFLAGADGHLSVWWGILILGAICLFYTIAGGFPAVLMTDCIQFGVLIVVVIFMIPLSFHAIGGIDNFIHCASLPDGFFSPVSAEYSWEWMILWFFLNFFMIGGDWPYVQRYISVPTAKDARKSNYLVGVLYLITPLIWYIPAMVYRVINPEANPEQAYILISQEVLMKGMLGVMLAAMLSATLSIVSGTLNVYANVFTYEIWGRSHKDSSEKQRIRVGRLFTLGFGLVIIALALLIPFIGGAEKVVVTILTLVICPLYIPSVWGLFSKSVTGKHVIIAMCITYALGFALKFPLAGLVSPQLLDAAIGLLIPVCIMTIIEIIEYRKKKVAAGFLALDNIRDEKADHEPDAHMRKAVKSYSFTAITCFCSTLLMIAVLLTMILFTESMTDGVRQIVWVSIIFLMLICISYVVYRWIDSVRTQKEENGNQ
ncbi:MAG: sodium:solute symporter [Bacteroidaceae bacterium]|nr:sodium:solute symporter [Bacteroidaceae bacterium]